MQRAAAVVRAQLSLGQLGDAIRRATFKKQKHAAATDAVRSKSVVTFDAPQAESFFVEARRTIQVVDVKGRLENTGSRRHGKLPYRLETLFHQARYGERWRGNSSGSRLQVALDVFSQDVALEVHRVAGLSVADVGVVIGVRNDGHFRDAIVPPRDGEADAVNRDRSLRNDVACQLIGDFDAVPPVFAFSREMRNAADRVHVSQNKVAAQFLARSERLLEIHAQTGAKAPVACAKRRFAQSFAR